LSKKMGAEKSKGCPRKKTGEVSKSLALETVILGNEESSYWTGNRKERWEGESKWPEVVDW